MYETCIVEYFGQAFVRKSGNAITMENAYCDHGLYYSVVNMTNCSKTNL